MDFPAQNQCDQTPISSKSDKKWQSQTGLKKDRNEPFGPYLDFDRFFNFCISYPILMKLVSNCTNFESRSSFLASKLAKLQYFTPQIKIRSKFSRKTGFSGKNEFSQFCTARFWYQGTLQSSNPLKSEEHVFDQDFNRSGTLCLTNILPDDGIELKAPSGLAAMLKILHL